MKKILVAAVVFLVALGVYGQNEFAAKAFYRAFKNVYEDAGKGFVLSKGTKRNNAAVEEYDVKVLLPLADSGRIVVPASGKPYMEYYFEPAKTKAEIDERALHLKQAIAVAYDKPLYIRTESAMENEFINSKTFFYTDPNHINSGQPIFRSTIYQQNGKYYLSLRICGQQ
jgi:hypothetical protein